MNKVNLIGRTTKDIELRQTQSGKAVASFTLAVDRGIKNEDGTKISDFISCKVWGKTAEVMSKYVLKGNRVGITGRIETGSYDKDGTKVYTTDVVVEGLDFLESKKTEQAPAQMQEPDYATLPDTVDDDLEGLPF